MSSASQVVGSGGVSGGVVNIAGDSGTATGTTITLTGGSSGAFFTAGGNIESTGGDIGAFGDVIANGNVIAGTGMTVTAGNLNVDGGDITAVAGNIIASANVAAHGNLYTFGDDGTGTALSTSITNVVDNTQGAGALTLVSASANPGTNTGFLKFYVGTTPVFVPYFDIIAP